ncbi:MAG: thiamine pyrophosphate-binding protein [Deltaproteobacteria bacterium]|jgi:acetolactate synthase-1/2/3 large subunit|nr:thiamine pyrophosphate-binding protein [Deltaproteobacteria bacterium]
MPELSGGQALARSLLEEGVDTLFGLPGDQLMHALDALYDERDRIRFITTRHEQATTYMADGYARSSGRPGVAMVVPGVGVYNAAAGLATAYATCSPVLLIAGQVNRDGIGKSRGLLHDVHDQLEIVRPVTQWAKRILEAGDIPRSVQQAFSRLRNVPARPVEIEIPPEAFAEVAHVELCQPLESSRTAGDPDRLRQAAQWLAEAERPLLYAGGGVVLGDASESFTALVEKLEAAAVTSRDGKGAISARHTHAVGTAWVNRRLHSLIQDADVILAVGTRFHNSGAQAGQRVIHIDANPNEPGTNFPDAYGIEADARLALEALLAELDGLPPRTPRAKELGAARAKVESELRAIGPQAAIVDTLRAALPDETIVVAGTTTVGYMSHMLFPVYEPRTYLSSSYMGTLGFAFPTALGAKVGRPERPVVTLIGDGGFLFAASELATAVQHDIAAVTVVFNDGAYGNSNRDQRERFAGREIGTLLRNPDFAALAHSFGADGTRISGIEQLGDALREAIAGGRPALIECPIDRLPSPF